MEWSWSLARVGGRATAGRVAPARAGRGPASASGAKAPRARGIAPRFGGAVRAASARARCMADVTHATRSSNGLRVERDLRFTAAEQLTPWEEVMRVRFAMVVLTLIALSGCGGRNPAAPLSTGPASSVGQFKVMLTDAPAN